MNNIDETFNNAGLHKYKLFTQSWKMSFLFNYLFETIINSINRFLNKNCIMPSTCFGHKMILISCYYNNSLSFKGQLQSRQHIKQNLYVIICLFHC